MPAEANGMLTVAAQVTFRHSLLRSAIYGAASPQERRRAHQALADATDPDSDPDRRAWHRAHATVGTDEEVARELLESADRAQARGGLAATAAFLRAAMALTPDPGARARRALAAARATHLAGAPDAALTLLAAAAVGPLDDLDSALLTRLRGIIALDQRRGNDAVPLLLDAAHRLELLDPRQARDTYLEALRAAGMGGRFGDAAIKAARAARQAVHAAPDSEPGALDLLLEGIALRFTAGYASSVPTLQRALRAVYAEEGDDPRWPWMARRVAPDLFDDALWGHFAERNVVRARRSGALSVLPLALNVLATYRVHEGKLREAAALVAESDAIIAATGAEPMLIARLVHAGWTGDPNEAAHLVANAERIGRSRSEGVLLTFTEVSQAVLHNGLGRYADALAPAQSASSRDEMMLTVLALPELVEAAARSGQRDVATAAVARLSELTSAAGGDLALGLEARCRALVADGVRADELYREAVDRLHRTRICTAAARAHLLHGEWLRREGRRNESREQLRQAHDQLTAMGVAGFAERARRELSATGATVRQRDVEHRVELTAQETQIAQLAVDGRTNVEIAAELFLSPRTVEWHLSKVFSKLGVTSRRQLRQAPSLTHHTRSAG